MEGFYQTTSDWVTTMTGNNGKVFLLLYHSNLWKNGKCLKKLLAKVLYGFRKKNMFHFPAKKWQLKRVKSAREFK